MSTEIIQAIAGSPTIQALGIGAMILFFGFQFLRRLDKDSPFAPYAIQILALIIILPVVLTLALMAPLPLAFTVLLASCAAYGPYHPNTWGYTRDAAMGRNKASLHQTDPFYDVA